ncbi:hypothetical protein TFLX_00797 [Thermoflexales bacterium]|nr:hypothetical protein TFLX_00797 [Thermoflexales bacterium]
MDMLWNELHDLFDDDDGGLYDIWITNLTPLAIVNIYTLLCTAASIIPNQPTFWDKHRDQVRALESVPNAAQLVVNDEAEPFHFLVQGIVFGNVILPDLGVFVSPDMITLDYRKGPEWRSTTLHALFDLFAQIQRNEPAAKITLPDMVLPTVRQRFEQALTHYVTQGPQQDVA